jgi:hypothetical protein
LKNQYRTQQSLLTTGMTTGRPLTTRHYVSDTRDLTTFRDAPNENVIRNSNDTTCLPDYVRAWRFTNTIGTSEEEC